MSAYYSKEKNSRCLSYVLVFLFPVLFIVLSAHAETSDTSQPAQNKSDGVQPPATPDHQQVKTITNSIGMQFVLIPPGEFTMGDSTYGIREVVITHPFYMSIHEVTQEQWHQIMETRPAIFQGPNRPVENISWEEAQIFLSKLSEKENVHYRLPTEAEWEYASRAGAKTRYYWGEKWDNAYGWCYRNSPEHPQDVGTKKPNAWGLYDMLGNVYEWCQDWHDNYAPKPTLTDPTGPTEGQYRVLRGGSWRSHSRDCIAAIRYSNTPNNKNDSLGFRVVRMP